MSSDWFSRRLTGYKKTGKLNLSAEPQFDMAKLSTKSSISMLRLMKELDVSYSPVKSLEGLPHFPNLISFTANTTKIDSLKNILSLEGVRKLSLKNTPVSKQETFRLSVYICLKDSISTINDQQITKTLKQKADKYPSCTAELINKGWELEYPCPSEEKIKELCQHFDVVYDDIIELDEIANDSIISSNIDDKTEIIFDDYEEDAIIAEKVLSEKHSTPRKYVPIRSPNKYIAKEHITELELASELCSVFFKHDIIVNLKDNEKIAKIVEYLCAHKK